MKKRISEEQIAFALRQVESGTPIGEVCRKMKNTKNTEKHRDTLINVV